MQTLNSDVHSAELQRETLGELLRRTVYTQLPSRLYGTLQLCLPLAVQFWLTGWHRTAGWLVVGSAFGLWGVAQQHLEGHADASDGDLAEARIPHRWWRAIRRIASVAGSVGLLLLGAEAFVQLMADVFKCPGCAG